MLSVKVIKFGMSCWSCCRIFFVALPLLLLIMFYYALDQKSGTPVVELHVHDEQGDMMLVVNGTANRRSQISTEGYVNVTIGRRPVWKPSASNDSLAAARFAQDPLPKRLLAWTKFFGDSSYMMPQPRKLKCTLNNCVITDDKSTYQSADAIMFHLSDVDMEKLPKSKPSRQRWLLVNFESSVNSPLQKLSAFGDKLDWLVSYLKNADFPSPYGKIRKREDSDPPPVEPSEKAFLEKLPAAWMVSNCMSRSGREVVARDIQKYIKLDVYGGCASIFGSSKRTLQRHGPLQGYDYLAQRYKFYMAFENSLCMDYITEKAFLPLIAGMVPVVLSRADLKSVLPPGSFVDVREFSSYDKLGSYLRELSSNFTAYKSYFEWRTHYVVEHGFLQNTFLCDLCDRLHQADALQTDAYKRTDIADLLNATENCVT